VIRAEVGECDVVHLHDCLYAANVATYRAARRARKPVVLTQHVAEVPYRNPAVRLLQGVAYASVGRRLLTGAEQVVFVSERVRRRFSGLPFKRSPVLIENGIDLALFSPSPKPSRRRPQLLFVGRFVEKKGLGLVREMAAATPDFDWVLVGRRGDVDPDAWRLANVEVRAAVPRSELPAVYAAADLLVVPSVGEGFPVAVQEAMACGTPAVVSDETARSLSDSADWLPRAAPEPGQFLAAIKAALDQRARLNRRVRQVAAQRWDVRGTAREYATLFDSLLESAGGNQVPPACPPS
jgi:glycosyltransferase involved in cell wall biosynthesis